MNRIKQVIRFALPLLLCAVCALAQYPGSSIGLGIQSIFTGPLVIGLTIAGIVVGGCLTIFGERGFLQVLGRVLIGGVLVPDAVKIVSYLQSVL